MTESFRSNESHNEVIARCSREAVEVGHDWVGAIHLVLAILRSSSNARLAMERAGIGYDEFKAKLGNPGMSGDPPNPHKLSTTYGLWGCLGMASGLALARGAGQSTDEDLLIALCYGTWDVHPNAFSLMSRNPEEVLKQLKFLQVQTPDPMPPPSAKLVRGERVLFPSEYKPAVMRALARLAPPGKASTWWGSQRPGTDWVQGPADLDLVRIVAEALGNGEGEQENDLG